ncbi:hypothetical protein CAOG_06449 [Capsaspora owczarzaki ATCC 30864]|uniref:hypothetical protein n=1 Tax=Capsaspora owczarzaki (strain ATCC 30864) TaxID=595528 RepID=UPI0001FE2FC4|nr:hypothetical protein CAOG_06449 [Capsaspora owczarzaki ATCC 30864]|eukprot:XP_004345198.1 hypothetical protein CAOG_06449 [Capsaspora owczarzaki ATCC 30864]
MLASGLAGLLLARHAGPHCLSTRIGCFSRLPLMNTASHPAGSLRTRLRWSSRAALATRAGHAGASSTSQTAFPRVTHRPINWRRMAGLFALSFAGSVVYCEFYTESFPLHFCSPINYGAIGREIHNILPEFDTVRQAAVDAALSHTRVLGPLDWMALGAEHARKEEFDYAVHAFYLAYLTADATVTDEPYRDVVHQTLMGCKP